MNTVQMRLHYETKCKRCKYFLCNKDYLPHSAESLCTAPKTEVMWILRVKGEPFSYMTWYNDLLKDCKFKEKDNIV